MQQVGTVVLCNIVGWNLQIAIAGVVFVGLPRGLLQDKPEITK